MGCSLPVTPKVTNLEIRADWDGNSRHPLDIRISVEVAGTPNALLQLIDLRSPTIELKKAIAHRIGHSEKCYSYQPELGSPLYSPVASTKAKPIINVDEDGDTDSESAETTVIHLTSERSSPVVEDTYENRIIGGLDGAGDQREPQFERDSRDDDGNPETISYIEPYSWLVDPKIFVSEDYLFFRNPINALPGPYKIILTASIMMPTRGSRDTKGWHELVISGLPRCRGGDSGFFLFQVPEEVGLELRTTNLCRFDIVEDCFCAEFIGDLVIPFRRCSSKYYGTIRSFTVDYDIQTEIAPGHSGISLTYHAVCSLKTHNFCYISQKCTFPIHIEGGPAGKFKCKLEPQQADIPSFHLETHDGHPTGVSQVEVVCPPRDLKLFVLSWTLNIPKRSSIWLPRIHRALSGSYARESDYLRSGISRTIVSTNQYQGSEKDEFKNLSEFSTYPEVDVMSDYEVVTWQQHPDINMELYNPADIYDQSPSKSEKEAATVQRWVLTNILVLTLVALFLGLGMDQSADIKSRLAVPSWSQVGREAAQGQQLDGFNGKFSIIRDGAETTGLSRVGQLQVPAGNRSQHITTSLHNTESHRLFGGIGELGKRLQAVTDRATSSNIRESGSANVEVNRGMSEDRNRRAKPSANISQTSDVKSFRDKLDYLLGWRGPYAPSS
ncbi:conserved hypothetical protein [Paecilomyces variotii No. 5]|uniref:Uncharacterized protein n=1 Tax=Byssochlamys spectabilis (strain No. 5 / NBRC 109023) TaxID=1356009 RepID=V5FR35_BYSSN|nr:conserved hypothetical protein [Paecilomyces variotii No. 5]